MNYIVSIKNKKTGVIRHCNQFGKFHEFWWSEGNGSCDCNRHLMFNGYEDGARYYQCGHEDYEIVDVRPSTGERTEEMTKFLGL